jgi:hypothetical protein
MRRGMWIVVVLLVILGAVGLGVGAYNAGLSEGVARAAEGGEAVRGVGHGYGYGFGFFPFGFLFPLLFFGLIFFAIRGAFWGRPWGGPGHWDRREQAIEDYHRRLHERDAGGTATGEAGTA